MITTSKPCANYAGKNLLVSRAKTCITFSLSTELHGWNTQTVNHCGQPSDNKIGSELGKCVPIHNPQPLLELSRVKQLNKYIESGNQVEVPM